nr:flagellar motor protein MotA [Pelagibacteraceae bacterium]
MQESLNQYLVRVAIFLALIFIVIVLLYPVLQNAFLSNIFINVIILIALGVGIVFNVVKLVALNSDYFVLANFDINNSVKSFSTRNGNLKNLTSDLKQIDGRYVFKSSAITRLIENIDMSMSSVRETSRYLVGLLVFLGLLGTFWGLLKTIGSVGNVISGLGIDDTNVAGFFNSLKDGLNAPLQGMSIAFSSSLLGLAGSLILGFMDINLGQAQNKFSLFFEKIVN